MKSPGIIFRPTVEKTHSLPNRRRWAVLTKEVITGNGPANRGVPMLTRYRLIQTPAFGLYVHHWHRPDADRDVHDHPWRFATLVLRGGYTEILADNPAGGRVADRLARRRPFSLHVMPRDRAHRVIAVRPSTWTLLLVGPKRQDWGFYVPNVPLLANRGRNAYGRHFVAWQTYIAAGGNPDPFNC